MHLRPSDDVRRFLLVDHLIQLRQERFGAGSGVGGDHQRHIHIGSGTGAERKPGETRNPGWQTYTTGELRDVIVADSHPASLTTLTY